MHVIRGDEATDAAIATAAADDHLVFDDQRRERHRIGKTIVCHLDVPQGTSGLRMNSNQMCVERGQKQRLAQHRQTPIVRSAARLVIGRRNVPVDPEDAPRFGIERDHVIGPLGHVHHAVDDKRGGLPVPEDLGLIDPLLLQILDV